MKNSLVLVIIYLLITTSCEKGSDDVFFKLGSGQEFRFSDIELYDTSTHILYLRKNQEYLEKMYENTFSFLNHGQLIYKGSFVPGYSSSIPLGPFIHAPSMYGTYALRIENLMHPNEQDVRKDPILINILSQYNLLHSGLNISESSIDITITQITFKFTVANHDQSNLMIIDPNKTGLNLFHYFTNGLYIYDLAHNEIFSSNIQHQAPDPWNSWKIEWLSELKSGESREFILNYTTDKPITPGVYVTTFRFPGLGYQVTKDQLYLGNSRIWLGDITLNERRTIK